jgi:hypothetical protein
MSGNYWRLWDQVKLRNSRKAIPASCRSVKAWYLDFPKLQVEHLDYSMSTGSPGLKMLLLTILLLQGL